MKKHCISAACTKVVGRRGMITWKTRVVKDVDKSVDKCPDCGNSLTEYTMHVKKRSNEERSLGLPY